MISLIRATFLQIAGYAQCLSIPRYCPAALREGMLMICMELTLQRQTTNLTHVACKNLQYLALTPREKSFQRLIQYSVITISLNGNCDGGSHLAISLVRRNTFAIDTRSDLTRNPSFFNLASSAFKLWTPNTKIASRSETRFPSSMCSLNASAG